MQFPAGQGGQLGVPGWAGGEGRRLPSPVTEPAREMATSGGGLEYIPELVTNVSPSSIFTPILASSFLGIPVVEKTRETFTEDYGSSPRAKVHSAARRPAP